MGCDLLSFKYFKTIVNSYHHAACRPRPVVICFHLSIFEPLETVDSTLVTGIQHIISSFRITKTKLFSIKNPA